MRGVLNYLSQLFAGLQVRLLLLVVLVCAPLVGLTIKRALEDRRHAVTNWRQRSQRMTELALREEEKVIGETRQLLLAMAESSPVRAGNRRGCKKLVDELFASYPRYANLGVISTNGEVLACALGSVSPTNMADQEFFRRAMGLQAFTIDDFPVGAGTDKPTVSFGYPVVDRFGQQQGVVFASLDLSWFNRFGSELAGQLPRAATWTEVDRNGNIVVRYPAAKEWTGQPLPEKWL